jgi:hypothetical protein
MAGFVIGDVKQVRELTWGLLVNSHLADGWVLLLVRAGQELDRNFDTGEEEKVTTTVYVIGWIGDDEPKSELFYQQELREKPSLNEADPF